MAFLKTIDEIKKYAGITNATQFNSLKPDIEDVESLHIVPILGNTLYASLHASYIGNTIVSDSIQEKLLFKIQKALVNIALEQYSSLAQLDFSDSGIRQIEDATFKSPKQWQIDDLREYFFMKGYRAKDELLEFLEDNKATFTTWASDSKAYTINKQFIVSDTKTFQTFYDIKNSRTTFIALQPTMKIVEMMHIMPNISPALYTRIKTQIAANNLTQDIKNILEMLQLAITQFTVASAIDSKIIEISKDGVYSRSQRTTMDSGREKTKADIADRKTAQTACLQIANATMENLRTFLNGAASNTVYPEYFASPLYVKPPDTGAVNAIYENEATDKVYYA